MPGLWCNENIQPYATDYGNIIVLVFPFVIVSTVMNAAIRTDESPDSFGAAA